MDTHHVMLSCTTWTKERREIHKKCEEDGGKKPRIVRQLIGVRKATPAVLGFIAATQVGHRALRKEQEVERQELERDKA